MSVTTGLAARRAALKLLDAVLRRGETLASAEHAAFGGMPAFADRALARAIAGEVLRWLTDLDALIDSATRQNLAHDAKARAVLRMMLAQWLRLATPPHAVVATGLALLAGGPRRLAHGVFGALVRGGAKLPLVPTLPAAVAERWGERAATIAAGLAEPPPLDISVVDPDVTTQDWEQTLGGESLARGHVRIPRGASVTELPGYTQGAWWVQDLAASLPARLVGAKAGDEVLDLCAAPGGKAMQLAADQVAVTMLDASEERLERVRQNFARVAVGHHEIIHADLFAWDTDKRFDAVLLDAPCTATGTCRRHPDVLHRIKERQIAEMAELQARMVERAARWVKPGGRLVYAVCSLEREEGEDIARQVPLTPDPINANELPAGLHPTPEGWLRTDPSMLADKGGLDGFFVAKWRNPGG